MCAQVSTPTPSESLFLPLLPGAARGEGDLPLCRATLYAALALGFRPPSPETLQRLTSTDAASALADAARELDLHTSRSPRPLGEGQGEGMEALSAKAAALAREDVSLDALTADFLRLFGHTARGEVPPYETEYGEEALFQQPQEMSDIAGFMRAFGLVMRPESHERVDHVSCECEFLSFLACKEAYAIDAGDDEMLAMTQQATDSFLRDHLAHFAPTFTRRLRRADQRGFYGAVAELLRVLVEFECERLSIPAGSERLGVRPDPAACAAPMGCESSCGTEVSTT